MNYIQEITAFFGWCVVINVVFFLMTSIAIMVFKDKMMYYHQRLFGVSESALACFYFGYLGCYKLLIVLLFFVPYLALKIMA